MSTTTLRASVLASIVVLLDLCFVCGLRAADDKAPDISEVRVRTIAPITYAYVETETTFDKLGEAIGAAMPQIQKLVEAGKIKVTSPFILYYPQGSAHMTPDKPFKVQIGLKIEGDGKGEGDVKVRTAPEFKAATVVYTGPVSQIGQCYGKLFPAIAKMGLTLSGEEREYTLYFEELESPNNVVMAQVGVKEKVAGGGLAPLLNRLVPQGSAPAAQAKAADAAPNQPPLPAELKFFDPYVGTWDAQITIKPGPARPEGAKTTGTSVIQWAMKGRYLEVSGANSDGTEAINLMTFDGERGEYRSWHFHSSGNTSKATGRWDEKTRTFSWSGDSSGGSKFASTDRWIADDKRQWNVMAMNRDGNVVFEMEAIVTKRKPGAAAPAKAEAKAADAPPLPEELKALDRYAGTWDGRSTIKPGPWAPQEVKQENVGVFKWALGGRFMRIDDTSATAGEAVHFMGFDPQSKEYHYWFFHSIHPPGEHVGNYDAKSQTFTWTGEGPPGMKQISSDRWINKDQRNWGFVIKDGDGKMMFEMDATSTRRK